MDMEDIKISLVLVLIVATVISVSVGISYWVSSNNCEAAWAQSGYKSEYNLWGGCLVQRKDGTWVPDKAIRDINTLDDQNNK